MWIPPVRKPFLIGEVKEVRNRSHALIIDEYEPKVSQKPEYLREALQKNYHDVLLIVGHIPIIDGCEENYIDLCRYTKEYLTKNEDDWVPIFALAIHADVFISFARWKFIC